MSDPIPAIQSAYLNLTQTQRDCEWAKDAYGDDRLPDCLMWIDNALSQLQSARAKIAAHLEKEKA